MRKFLKWFAALLVLTGLAAGAYSLLAPKKRPPKVLASAEVEMGSVRKVLEATGVIKAQVGAVVKIGARATGAIREMNVRVGDKVEKGQIIARIDDREEQARLAEAEARLAKAEATLNQVESVYPARVNEAEALLRLAEAKLEYAQSNLKRRRALFKKNIISRDDLEQLRRDAMVAVHDAAAKKASAVRLGTEFEKERVKARTAVEEAKAALTSVRTKLSYAKIVSPIDGVVAYVTSQQGETIVAGLQVANLITVLDPARLEMWIYVDETDVGQVRPGMAVNFRVDAHPGETFTGRVDQIYPQPEIRDNIVYYQALVRLEPSESDELRPEMTTQCRIVVQEKHNVPVIPNAAVKWVGAKQVVFVVGPEGRTTEVQPKLGLAGLDETEVLGGLEPGQRVATQIILSGAGGGKKTGAEP